MDEFNKLNELEELRIKAKNRKILIGIISVVIIILFFILSIIMDFRSITYIGVALSGIVAKALYDPIKNFSSNYKETFVETELQKSFNNLVYKPFEGIDENTIKNTGMMQMGNCYESNDYIEADYNGVHFKQADVCIQNQSRNGKSTLFRGRWMVFDFNKEFKTNMQIVHKNFSNSANPNSLFNRSQVKYETIKVENDDFNKVFVIRAQDEHDVFYILTPHFMENMLKLSSDVGRQMMFCFINSQLYVAIYTNKDSFENSAYHKIDPEVEKEEIVKDIALITAFVDELKLDRQLFK